VSSSTQCGFWLRIKAILYNHIKEIYVTVTYIKLLVTMKPSCTISLIFTLALLVSCVEKTVNEKMEPTKRKFVFPELKIDIGNGEYINSSKQLSPRTYILQNTSTSTKPIDAWYHGDSLSFSISNDVELYVDYSQEFTIKYIDSYLPPSPKSDSSGSLAPQGYCPFDSVKVFPAYIVNNTDSIQGIKNQRNIIVIQEALNTKNEWKPVEFFRYADCGLSYGVTLLDTNCYIMFGVNKYKGDFKTKLRLRLKTNGKTIYSNEFLGYINKSQLIEVKEEQVYHDYLRDGY
jgi:hypothetical protein